MTSKLAPEGMITVEKFAEKNRMPVDQVIRRISSKGSGQQMQT
jgi:hypothetical protein